MAAAGLTPINRFMVSPEEVTPKSKAVSGRKFWLLFLSLGNLLVVGLCGFAYVRFREWTSCPLNVAMCVHLNISGRPTVGNPVQVNVEVIARKIASPNTTLTISLPPQIELLEGNLEWQGDLAAEERIQQTVSIIVIQPGEWPLSANAFSGFGDGYGYGDGDGVFILSSAHSAQVSRERSPNHWTIPGNGAAVGPGLPSATSFKMDNRFETSIALSGQPNLHQRISVTYALTTTIPITDANMNLIYPLTGFELTGVQFSGGSNETRRDNPLVWRGNLESGQSVSIIATFKITDVGRGPIVGFLSYIEPRDNVNYVIQTAGRLVNLEVNKYAGAFQIATPEPP
jgi:hypothetical protein